MPEAQNIEDKQSWHDDYLKWVCGFGNLPAGRQVHKVVKYSLAEMVTEVILPFAGAGRVPEILRIKEYSEYMIAEAVTGKMKV